VSLSSLPIILGSSSPRRRELLGWTGLPFEVARPDIDESVLPGENPSDYVLRLCREKASAIAATLSHDALIICADTTVALEGEIIGKPEDAADAVRILRHLRGKTHQVYTGVCVMVHRSDNHSDNSSHGKGNDSTQTEVIPANVIMRDALDTDIEGYVASGKAFGKAGAYGIQDREFRLVERLDGCFTTVVGFPMCAVTRLLNAHDLHVTATTCDPTHQPCVYAPAEW
jgi:septum formation protein